MIPERYKDDFTDFEPLTIGREERAALDDLHRRAIAGEVEYGQGRTGGRFTEVFTSGKPNGVQIPKDILSAPGLCLYHAHTNVTPLSADDFKLLTGDNIERVSVVTRNGDVYSAWIGGGERPSAEEFEEVMGWLRPEVDDDMLTRPESSAWSIRELNYMSIREQAFRIARHFKWHLEGGKL